MPIKRERTNQIHGDKEEEGGDKNEKRDDCKNKRGVKRIYVWKE